MDSLGSFYLFSLISHHSVFSLFHEIAIFSLSLKKNVFSGMPSLFFLPSSPSFFLLVIHKYECLLCFRHCARHWDGVVNKRDLVSSWAYSLTDVTESHPALPSRFVYSSDLLIVLFDFFSPCWPIPSMNYFKFDSYSLVLTDNISYCGWIVEVS